MLPGHFLCPKATKGWRGALGSQARQFAGADEDPGEHGAVEAAGVGVSQRGVIAGEQVDAVGHGVFGGMGEAEGGAGADDLRVEEVCEVAVEGDLAEADDDADTREGGELVREVLAAVADLFGGWLIAGRGAADDGGDPGIAEFQAIIAIDGALLGGETEFMEDGVHEVAGAVSSERTAGAIGSMGTGSEPQKQNSGARISEARDRARPVGLVDVGSAASFADRDAEGAETWTALAKNDLLLDLLQLSRLGDEWHELQ